MNWLFKEEPTHYSYDAFAKDKGTVWSGVKNPVAQRICIPSRKATVSSITTPVTKKRSLAWRRPRRMLSRSE
jgi:hypothetical protein